MPGDDAQTLRVPASQPRNHLLRHPVAEVLLPGMTCQVLERQHRHNRLARSGLCFQGCDEAVASPGQSFNELGMSGGIA